MPTKTSELAERSQRLVKNEKPDFACDVNQKLVYHFPGAAAAMFMRPSPITGLTLPERILADTEKVDAGAPDAP